MHMKGNEVYLRQNVQVEPLVNGWYAWVHLLSPATNAMNLTERYLAIMESYIDAPAVHAIAVKDPAMRGGPFIDLEGRQVEEVRSLREKTVVDNQEVIAFAQAVQALNALLREQAKGYCLEPLYQEVPDLLKGYVELQYDLNHHPSFRFFEPLLYKSPYYSPASQSIALSEIRQDGDRAFILSTPRLADENTLHLPVPFAHAGLDELFKMKFTPRPLAHIAALLNVEAEQMPLFESFFTPEAPPRYEAYEGENLRIRYFGHACILIETSQVSILLDPILSYTYESGLSRYTYLDLPERIDYVLITHSHQDHILIETMLQIRHKVGHVVIGRNLDGAIQDPSLKLALNHAGFHSITELREMEEIGIPGGTLTGIPFMGEHHDLLMGSKLGYSIKVNGRSVLAVADSCNVEPRMYELVHRLIGDVDILFLGMECDGSPLSWVYGPLFDQRLDRNLDRSRKGRGCNYAEGIRIVNQFNCRQVYVYAMGQEPWLRHILDIELTDSSNPVIQARHLIDECTRKGILAESLFGEKEIL